MSKERIRELRAKAIHAREHASRVADDQAAANLRNYAIGLEVEAAKLAAQAASLPASHPAAATTGGSDASTPPPQDRQAE